ncbi:hypothetical protein HHI36_019895 [Cryptolaemus montrouzieri]|uniref:Uncharacterized protein n=1 Tax=Cryptolaemus montrouzieri TaxID=559131 RepID=A0ABD2N937_9CUCU
MDPKKKEKLQTWSEINRNRKRERKEWKEKSLLKKKKVAQIEEPIKQSTDANQCQIDNIELSTVSFAIPGSILENAQSIELRTYLAGQIARAACLFQIDEIVVFDDYGDEVNTKKSTLEDNYGMKTMRHCCIQLARILQYLECPQYLRKNFFPIHKDLKYSGLLNPLNAPHHLSANEHFEFREGVVSNKPVKPGRGSIVNVGLRQDVHVDRLLTVGLRCTVHITSENLNDKKLKGVVVSPDIPRKKTGIYWGYSVRLAKTLTQVFSQCPYKQGYDLTVGTSDKGSSLDEFICPSYKHMLIIFGGVQGIEFALENDPALKEDDPRLLFDEYLNTLPQQGSKTIRTEEAILISLAGLRPKLNPLNPPIIFKESSNDVDLSCSIVSSENNVIVDEMSRFD